MVDWEVNIRTNGFFVVFFCSGKSLAGLEGQESTRELGVFFSQNKCTADLLDWKE